MWRALLIVAASAVVVGPAHAGPTGEPEPELRALLAKNINAADSFEHRFDAEVWLVDMSGRLRPYMKDEGRSEEHTSELQSLMRNSYAVFCLKKKKKLTKKQKASNAKQK